MARELHDSVAQHVFSPNVTADALRLGLAGGRATDAEWLHRQAKQLADSSQQALEDLRPRYRRGRRRSRVQTAGKVVVVGDGVDARARTEVGRLRAPADQGGSG